MHLIFGGEEYYPSGPQDLLSTAEELQAAKDLALQLLGKRFHAGHTTPKELEYYPHPAEIEWVEVLDVETKTIYIYRNDEWETKPWTNPSNIPESKKP